MAIDYNIYSTLRNLEAPSWTDAQQKAMSLKQMAMQNQQAQKTIDDQEAMDMALARNLNPDGTINRSKTLGELASMRPSGLSNASKNLSALEKAQGESKLSNFDLVNKVKEYTMPDLLYLDKLPKEQRPQAYQYLKNRWASSGFIPMDNVDPEYNDAWLQRTIGALQNYKPNLENQKIMADIASSKASATKQYADIGKIKDEKLPTKDQYAAATFGTRAKQAEQVFSDLSKSGFDPTSFKSSLSASLPSFLEGTKSEDVKKQLQAQRNFINAVLRRESGAAIAKDEFASAAAQYFPSYGDTPEVLKQKEQNRKTAIASLLAEGGPAMSKVSESIQNISSEMPYKKNKNQSKQLFKSIK